MRRVLGHGAGICDVLMPPVSARSPISGPLCLRQCWRGRDYIDNLRLLRTPSGTPAEGLPRVTRYCCEAELLDFQRQSAKKFLYRIYVKRVVSVSWLSFDPKRDDATSFETM